MSHPRSRRARVTFTALLAAAVTAGVGAGAAFAEPNTNNDRKLEDAVTVEGVMRHLRAFQGIADANGGTRASSTPGHEASAAYVAGLMRAAGYDVTEQRFPFLYTEETRESLRVVSPTPQSLPIDVMQYSRPTPVGGITAPLAVVPVDATPGCEATDFATAVYTGTIALVKRGGCYFSEKAANATAAGAVGVIVYNNDTANPDDLVNGTLSDPANTFAPTGGTSYNVGVGLTALAASGPVEVNLDLEELREERETVNVVAQTRQGRTDNVVMLGAHLDSVPGGAGINDNGSGSAGLLEVALRFAKTKPNNAVRFAWWGAEEFGLLGSEWYVDHLTEAQRDDIALYLNFDMIASPNYFRGIYDGDNSDNVGSPAGPAGSAQIEKAFEKFFADRGLPYEGTDFSGRSDYGPFIAVGIPAGGLFTGAEGRKTAAQAEIYGGTAGEAYDPCYHSTCDTIANIDTEVLDGNVDAIANVLVGYAFDTSSINGVRSPGRSHGEAGPHTHDAVA